MPPEETARIVSTLVERGYNVDREAATLLARASDPARAIDRVVASVPEDTLVVTATQVRQALDGNRQGGDAAAPGAPGTGDPSVSGGDNSPDSSGDEHETPVETGGSTDRQTRDEGSVGTHEPATTVAVSGDIQSTGTGEYGDFVDVFRDRYERLSDLLRGRVNHRPAATVADLSDGSETGLVGMVADVRTTTSGHLRLELEDTTGTYPCLVLKDRPVADIAETVVHDEVVAVEGRVSRDADDDRGILFVEDLYFPDVPHTHSVSTADRPVRAALVSDIHVGSEEFRPDAWGRFADWLHTDDAADVEYLLVAGDMVEGVGVYPGQDEELDIVDIYDQYERFSEHLKAVPGDMEVVLIPGNHDAVRLAEPQPAFDEELREIMSAHDATISANPSTVTIEGVSVLMYHGVALDELVATLPEAAYERPAETMTHLLRKRHLAPQYGGQVRVAPEPADHLVIDEVPDIFHAGHVHKFGYTRYRGVLTVNSSCWQSQTDFQQSVNLDPDVGYAPIVDLQTLDLQYGQFA